MRALCRFQFQRLFAHWVMANPVSCLNLIFFFVNWDVKLVVTSRAATNIRDILCRVFTFHEAVAIPTRHKHMQTWKACFSRAFPEWTADSEKPSMFSKTSELVRNEVKIRTQVCLASARSLILLCSQRPCKCRRQEDDGAIERISACLAEGPDLGSRSSPSLPKEVPREANNVSLTE